MPRLPRLHVPGGCYHVILRGNHRENLFSTVDDRLKLNLIVAEAIEKYGARVHAFCWMTNHLHALMQIGEMRLGKVVQRIAVRYSRYRHKQLHTTGHLFERRYRAWLVETDLYFVTLLRYIHWNPVKARMVEHLDEHAWSSHLTYLGINQVPWLTTDFGLSLFGSTVDAARKSYQFLMQQELVASEESVLEQAHPDDRRVLGSDGFLAALPPLRIKAKSKLTLLQLATQICEQESVTVEEICSSSKRVVFSKVRAEIVRRAIDGRIANLQQIATFMNRTPAALCRLQQRRSTSEKM